MTRPHRIEINCTTGVETIIELTDEEIVEREQFQIQEERDLLERNAIAEAKSLAKASAEAKLSALGLTPEEIAALS